ncbi:MAG: MFS transporter [Candidatus Thorarchaeota archaeon]
MNELVENPLEVTRLDSKTKSLLIRYVLTDFTRLITFNISGMFVVLYILETLEPTQAGMLFALNYLILALVDYPTGVLGDIIGYRKVMLIAYFFYVLSFIFLLVSNSFLTLLLYSGLVAIGASQESGALESWFDNNYNYLAENKDPKRQLYKSFQAKKSLVGHLLYGISVITGGIIASYFSRKHLFAVTLFLTVIVFILITIIIKDSYLSKSNFTPSLYFQQFQTGFKFLLSQKGIFMFFIGTTIIWAANNSIWVNFLLFPIYGSYSGGQDDLTAMLRALIFVSGVFWQIFIVKYISKIQRIKLWIFITTALSNPVFFLLVYFYYLQFPPTGLDLSLVLGLFIVFQLPGIWEPLEFILRNRLNLDLVPNEIRNGIYSLLPTITTIIGIPGALVGGYILKTSPFSSAILVTALFSSIGVILTGMGLSKLPKIKGNDYNVKNNFN